MRPHNRDINTYGHNNWKQEAPSTGKTIAAHYALGTPVPLQIIQVLLVRWQPRLIGRVLCFCCRRFCSSLCVCFCSFLWLVFLFCFPFFFRFTFHAFRLDTFRAEIDGFLVDPSFGWCVTFAELFVILTKIEVHILLTMTTEVALNRADVLTHGKSTCYVFFNRVVEWCEYQAEQPTGGWACANTCIFPTGVDYKWRRSDLLRVVGAAAPPHQISNKWVIFTFLFHFFRLFRLFCLFCLFRLFRLGSIVPRSRFESFIDFLRTLLPTRVH